MGKDAGVYPQLLRKLHVHISHNCQPLNPIHSEYEHICHLKCPVRTREINPHLYRICARIYIVTDAIAWKESPMNEYASSLCLLLVK